MTITRINRQPKVAQLELTADDFDFLLKAYIKDKRRTIKPHTQRDIAIKAGYFARFWAEKGPACNWILTPTTFADYNDWLFEESELAFLTRQSSMVKLRSMFRWAFKTGYIPSHDLSLYVQAAKGQPKAYRPAPGIDVWRAIWEQCDKGRSPARARALFAAMAGTGMRIGECAALRVDDLEFKEDASGFATIRTSKTGASRRVAFDDVTGQVLRTYMDAYNIVKGALFASWFETATGSMTKSGLYRVLDKAAERAGVAGVYQGTHDFRRAFATQWTLSQPGEGYSWLLAKQLGHAAHQHMTARYSRTDSEDIRQVLLKKKPLSLFSQVVGAK